MWNIFCHLPVDFFQVFPKNIFPSAFLSLNHFFLDNKILLVRVKYCFKWVAKWNNVSLYICIIYSIYIRFRKIHSTEFGEYRLTIRCSLSRTFYGISTRTALNDTKAKNKLREAVQWTPIGASGFFWARSAPGKPLDWKSHQIGPENRATLQKSHLELKGSPWAEI